MIMILQLTTPGVVHGLEKGGVPTPQALAALPIKAVTAVTGVTLTVSTVTIAVGQGEGPSAHLAQTPTRQLPRGIQKDINTPLLTIVEAGREVEVALGAAGVGVEGGQAVVAGVEAREEAEVLPATAGNGAGAIAETGVLVLVVTLGKDPMGGTAWTVVEAVGGISTAPKFIAHNPLTTAAQGSEGKRVGDLI